MSELLTESFCERCGTRYTFESGEPESKRTGLKKARVLARGLRNFVMSDEVSFDTAMTEARRDEERSQTTMQLEAFHETFNFCMDCRQYTCHDCWNEAEGRCLSCAPAPGHLETALYPERGDEVDGSDRLAALLGGTASPPPLQLTAPAAASSAWPEAPAVDATPAPPLVLRPYTLDRQTAHGNGSPAAPPQPEFVPAAEALPAAETAPTAEPIQPVEMLLEPLAEDEVEPEAIAPAQAAAPIEAVGPAEAPETATPGSWAAGELATDEEMAERPSPPPLSLEEALLAGAAAAADVRPSEVPPLVEVAGPAEPEPRAAEAVEPAEPEEGVAAAAPEPMPRSAEPPEPIPSAEPVIPRVPLAPVALPPPPVTAPASPDALPAAATAAPRMPGWDVVAPEAGSRTQGVPVARAPSNRDVQPAAWFAARTTSSVWEVSAAQVVDRAGVGIQACVSCGLPLSASAHFCRRCGSRQAA